MPAAVRSLALQSPSVTTSVSGPGFVAESVEGLEEATVAGSRHSVVRRRNAGPAVVEPPSDRNVDASVASGSFVQAKGRETADAVTGDHHSDDGLLLRPLTPEEQSRMKINVTSVLGRKLRQGIGER